MLRLDSIDRTFLVGGQAVHALRGVDLTIEAGEYIAIMGPSGSGKSTLLHVLGLLDRPDRGTYTLRGRDVTALSEPEQAAVRREQFGFVFQAFHLVARLSALENVELPMLLAGVSAGERAHRATEALATLGLAERSAHRPDQLSGGQRQRVAIARAIVMHPRVLLADEPTGNLDRASGEDVIGTLESLNRDGLTVLVVTHDPQIGARARRRVQMDDGRISEDRLQT